MCVICTIGKLPKDRTKHFAFDRDCPTRKERLEMAHQLRITGPQFHAPVPRCSEAPKIDLTTEPSPAEAEESQSRSRLVNKRTTAPTAEPSQTNRPKPRLAARTRKQNLGQGRGNARSRRSTQNDNVETENTQGVDGTEEGENPDLHPEKRGKKQRIAEDDPIMDTTLHAHQRTLEGELQHTQVKVVKEINQERADITPTPENVEGTREGPAPKATKRKNAKSAIVGEREPKDQLSASKAEKSHYAGNIEPSDSDGQ